MEKEKFNFGRFRKYFAHDLLRCIKQVGLATLLTGLIPAILLFCSVCMFTATGISDWSLDRNFTAGVAIIASILYLLFMPIPCYGELTDKRKGGNFLMLPASHTEKYVSMLINCLIIFPLGFAALYFGTDALLVTLFPARYEAFAAYEILCRSDASSFTTQVFFLPPMVSSAGLCGSLLFKKRKASKTYITCAVSFLVFLLIIISIAQTDIDFHNINGMRAWYIFQTFCTLCLLAYIYIKTKKIQL